MPNWFERFKETKLVKGTLYAVVGILTYPGIALLNKLKVNGMEGLHKLPKNNVLFVSNHQTYFIEVITFLQIFFAVRWRKKHGLGIPYYLLWPWTKIKFVAAEETMKSSFISRIFILAGAITVKRTWVGDGKEVRTNLDPSDTRNIARALENNWVITFPQGTTKPFAPARKGTAFIIKHHRPIVVPIVIDGFWRAFGKKGLKIQKKGTLLTVTFKEPMQIDYDDTVENILESVMDAIEQSKKFMPQAKHHFINKVDNPIS